MRRGPCCWGRLLTVTAVAVVTIMALCPRGMLRAEAMSELDRPVASPTGSVELGPPAELGATLPGVRATVARDDEATPDELLREVAVTAVLPEAGDADADEPGIEPPPDDLGPATCAPPARPCGDRAPPRSI